MSNIYDYKILREEVEIDDFFHEKTHEKIANSLKKLINDEENGITIGLAGQWGSGKSTIIKLLKKEKNFTFFYFDAWAHEGDPLRRIFLESLINCLKGENISDSLSRSLEKIRKIISREERVKTTVIKRSTTLLGLLFVVATFLMTIGISLLSAVEYSNLTFKYTGKISLVFYVGFVFSITPFLLLLGNFIYLKKEKKDYKDLKNWSFLQNNSTETITESISDDEERTSIEFERYFKSIIDLFKAENNRKFVIILDNLDRIDANDSLKIWSTLQTFIQHKNPNSGDYSTFKNIFTIIPYDEESLEKIWENYKEDENGIKKIDKEFSKSFFDKSFQVRIDVPKPILSNWLGFTKRLLDDNFSKWKSEDKEIIIEVLQVTRKDVLDNPKPREIKNYLNQIGFLRNHFSNEISTKSIAYYVYKRYLENKSNVEIAEDLEQKIGSNKNALLERNFLTNGNIVELASITYGVSIEKGREILLIPKIQNALKDESGIKLNKIEDEYKNVFWTLFKNIISKTNGFYEILFYSQSIFKAFDKKNLVDIRFSYIDTFAKYLNEDINIGLSFDKLFTDNIKSAVYLQFNYGNNNEVIKSLDLFNKILIDNLDKKTNKSGSNEKHIQLAVNFIIDIINYTKINFKPFELDLQIDDWKTLIEFAKENNFYGYYLPNQNIINETADYINQGVKIEGHIISIADYYLKSKVNNLDKILNKLLEHYKWNGGSQASNVFDLSSFELFYNFYINYKDFDFSPFFNSHELYSVLYSNMITDSKNINKFSTLCGIYFKEQVSIIELETNNNSSKQMLVEIKRFWSTSDDENASEVIEVFKENNCIDLIWEIVKDSENELACQVIKQLIFNEEEKLLTDEENPFKKLLLLNSFDIDDEEFEKIVTFFILNSSLIGELIVEDFVDLVNCDRIYYFIFKNTVNEHLKNKIIKATNEISKEEYLDALDYDDNLLDLMLEIKKTDNNFKLGFPYYEAINEFSTGSFLKDNESYELSERQILNWNEYVNLLESSYLEQIKIKNAKLIIKEKTNLGHVFFEVNINFIDKQFVISKIKDDIKEFKLDIEKALMPPYDSEKLFYINHVFNLDVEKNIHFKNFKEVITEPINKALKEDNSNEIKQLIENIAKRLNIKVV